MPKFVLAPGATPLDHLTSEQISDLISQLTGPNEKLNQKVFSFDEKWAIYNQLVALGDDTGWPVTRQQRNNYVGKFTEAPKEILIPAIEVQKFFVEMKKLGALLPSPTVNEFALRFHLGESGGSYSAVLIPMYGQIPVGGVPSSRLNEKEKEIFTSTGLHFLPCLFNEGLGSGFVQNKNLRRCYC
ncbi:MAG: hypothetical protein IPP93_05980 [Chitinophagaceae bacterium]|nr:hypothetical protein [Chitinophagaceae bacterium]